MAGHFTWNDWDWKAGSAFRNSEDPTDTTVDNNELQVQDGNEPFAERSAGSGDKGDVWAGSSYTFSLNTLYQVAPDRPWGFNVGASVTGREGFVSPPYAPTSGGRRVQLAAFDQDYVLQRQRNVEAGVNANQVREVLSPRVFRLGVKLHFR
jgi:hypothetical protein